MKLSIDLDQFAISRGTRGETRLDAPISRQGRDTGLYVYPVLDRSVLILSVMEGPRYNKAR